MSNARKTTVPPPVISDIEFCPWCGSILPLVQIYDSLVKCQRCHFERHVKEYKDIQNEFTIYFNDKSKKEKKIAEQGLNTREENELSGPTVERECPRCKHDIMTFTTRQTRSADEGQTVFYTCLKCSFQDIEYS